MLGLNLRRHHRDQSSTPLHNRQNSKQIRATNSPGVARLRCQAFHGAAREVDRLGVEWAWAGCPCVKIPLAGYGACRVTGFGRRPDGKECADKSGPTRRQSRGHGVTSPLLHWGA